MSAETLVCGSGLVVLALVVWGLVAIARELKRAEEFWRTFND